MTDSNSPIVIVTGSSGLLGWRPQHRLMEVLPEMIATLKHDPRAWYEQNDLEPPEDLKENNETHG